jgi:hypothetical protein
MAVDDLEDSTSEDDKHPCTHAGCSCPDFVSGKLSSVICLCGHETKEHGLSF